jgi:hypothetical protein
VKWGGGRGARATRSAITISLVSLLVLYAAVKLVPMWWQARKVDEVLDSFRYEARQLSPDADDAKAYKLLDDLWDKLGEMGIDEDQALEVYFSDDRTTLYADYGIEVEFLFAFEHTFRFHRSCEFAGD